MYMYCYVQTIWVIYVFKCANGVYNCIHSYADIRICTVYLQEELAVQSCVIYHHILMYMGDIPGRRTRLGMELTDVIFDGPLKHVSVPVLHIS